MSRYRVTIGKDFEIDSVDIDPRVDLPSVIEAKTKQDETATRSLVSLGILIGIATALVVAALMRLVDGDFGAVQAVWAAVSAPLGWIANHYFEVKD